MLLETLDIKKNDIIIYSQNKFDLQENFRIIFKDDPGRDARKISFKDVCKFVNQYTPKNMIVYRLLTNIRDFEIYLSKYGFVMNVNNAPELIYFDPIFAVKELEEYTEAINHFDLRFRIQQVGLTTLNRVGELPNYAEIYNIDLTAIEAKFQNDKSFVDALFLDKNKNLGKSSKPVAAKSKGTEKKVITKTEPKKVEQTSGLKKTQFDSKNSQDKQTPTKTASEKKEIPGKIEKTSEYKDGIKFISHDIAEDEDFDIKNIMKLNNKVKSKRQSDNSDKSIPRVIKKTAEATPTNFSQFIKQKGTIPNKTDNSTKEKLQSDQLIDIFKSPSSLNKFLKGKEDKKVVLRLKNKK